MNFIDHIFNKIQKNSYSTKIVSISGESGTGKTTLALQLVSHFLSESPFNCCIWIQASEFFPYKRLKSLFQKESDRLSFLEKKILVTPEGHTFTSYEEQSEFLFRLCSRNMVLPPHLKCMVIDNISHYLRYKISTYSEIQQVTKVLDRFFEDQLFPLICFCQRENIYLLLIHEISYNLFLERNRAFYSKLYDRIKALSIEFSIEWNQNQKNKVLKIKGQDKTNILTSRYTINQEGISLL
jgi:hypothetical protein